MDLKLMKSYNEWTETSAHLFFKDCYKTAKKDNGAHSVISKFDECYSLVFLTEGRYEPSEEDYIIIRGFGLLYIKDGIFSVNIYKDGKDLGFASPIDAYIALREFLEEWNLVNE